MDGRCLIGTCGFSYDHWRNIFYPPGLPAVDRLAYYSRVFETVEIDSTFYRLPSPAVVDRWREETPAGFRFAVKGSRYITHVKRLRGCRDALETFWAATGHLGNKLDAVLWQTPPNSSLDVATVAGFLDLALRTAPEGVRQAFEFRAGELADSAMIAALEDGGGVCVLADGDRADSESRTCGELVYARLHGRAQDGFDYPETALADWAVRLRKWQAKGIDSYIYFNNDTNGFAVRNAEFLQKAVAK
jgi:uncharacterized protein YecE (DUF72 family)